MKVFVETATSFSSIPVKYWFPTCGWILADVFAWGIARQHVEYLNQSCFYCFRLHIFHVPPWFKTKCEGVQHDDTHPVCVLSSSSFVTSWAGVVSSTMVTSTWRRPGSDVTSKETTAVVEEAKGTEVGLKIQATGWGWRAEVEEGVAQGLFCFGLQTAHNSEPSVEKSALIALLMSALHGRPGRPTLICQ